MVSAERSKFVAVGGLLQCIATLDRETVSTFDQRVEGFAREE